MLAHVQPMTTDDGGFASTTRQKKQLSRRHSISTTITYWQAQQWTISSHSSSVVRAPSPVHYNNNTGHRNADKINPAQLNQGRESTVFITSPTSKAFQQRQRTLPELPILRHQYIVRNVLVLIGSRWRLQTFEVKTIMLYTQPTPELLVLDSIPDADKRQSQRFILPTDTMCTLTRSDRKAELKLQSSSTGKFRLRMRFTTAADASIWQQIIQKTLRHARWSKQLRPLAWLSKRRIGSVRVVQHLSSKQEFIVKELQHVRVDDSECSELQILRKLFRESSALVSDYRLVETRDSVQIIMNRFPGKNLLQVLQSSKQERLSEQQAQHIVASVAEQLQQLHALGVVHCDLKLENILLRDDFYSSASPFSTVRVIDFGGAYAMQTTKDADLRGKLNDQHSKYPIKRMVGTPGYIAPERLTQADDPPTPTCDVFSFGVVLFQLLTGTHPFVEANDPSRKPQHALRLRDVLALDWRRAEQQLMKAEISHAGIDLVKQMMAMNSKERITVTEMLNHSWLRNV